MFNAGDCALAPTPGEDHSYSLLPITRVNLKNITVWLWIHSLLFALAGLLS